jgi:hypothetical protein
MAISLPPSLLRGGRVGCFACKDNNTALVKGERIGGEPEPAPPGLKETAQLVQITLADKRRPVMNRPRHAAAAADAVVSHPSKKKQPQWLDFTQRVHYPSRLMYCL